MRKLRPFHSGRPDPRGLNGRADNSERPDPVPRSARTQQVRTLRSETPNARTLRVGTLRVPTFQRRDKKSRRLRQPQPLGWHTKTPGGPSQATTGRSKNTNLPTCSATWTHPERLPWRQPPSTPCPPGNECEFSSLSRQWLPPQYPNLRCGARGGTSPSRPTESTDR